MKIKIGFCDFHKGFNPNNNFWVRTLQKLYGIDVIEVTDNPDYLFFSCFGFEHLKYECIKIFYTGENIVPDFNLCDYAIGFHEINFNDRYIRMPLYHTYEKAYCNAIRKHMKDDAFYLERKFCCSVISNALAESERAHMLSLLEGYKSVDNGGGYRNNIGGRVKDKLEFETHYKFTMCFENSSTIGYTTEKLLEGFAGGGIPIYWGNPNVEKEFNEKAFVNCSKFSSFEKALEYIKDLDNDDEKYLEVVREPIFTDKSGKGKQDYIQKNVEAFLRNIFDSKYENAYRRYRAGVGANYIQRNKWCRTQFELLRFLQRVRGFTWNKINS